ncbi:MAG: MFS transporter [Pseudoxanthomonas sp.]
MSSESLSVPADAADAPPLPRRARALILFALTLGGFAIGTSEFATMGLMPSIVRDLGVSEPQVGHLISAYALGVVVGAPLLALVGGSLPRKTLLLGLMGFYALGNLATALGPDYHGLLLFRFVAGLPHGAYFGVAALVAAAISRPEERGKAISLTMLGLTLAVLIGNPLASWMGQAASWRWAYAAVSLIALTTVVLTARFLPAEPAPSAKADAWAELRAFNRLPVWQALLIGAVGFSGFFCVFSYLAPTLLNATGVSEGWVPIGLAAVGLGGVVGNMLGGWLCDRMGFRGVAVVLAGAVAVLLLFPLAARAPWSVLPVAVVIGMMGALGPLLQSRLMDVAGEAQTLAAASHHAAFNTANALGPWLGGMAIAAGWGWTSTGYVGASTAVLGLLLYAWAARARPQAICAECA